MQIRLLAIIESLMNIQGGSCGASQSSRSWPLRLVSCSDYKILMTFSFSSLRGAREVKEVNYGGLRVLRG